jgi:hypothetical protein
MQQWEGRQAARKKTEAAAKNRRPISKALELVDIAHSIATATRIQRI